MAALRDALEQYKDQAERLEVQKQLLLHQVRVRAGGALWRQAT